MKNYEKLDMTFVHLTTEDVITSSMTGNGNGVYDGEEKEPEKWD